MQDRAEEKFGTEKRERDDDGCVRVFVCSPILPLYIGAKQKKRNNNKEREHAIGHNIKKKPIDFFLFFVIYISASHSKRKSTRTHLWTSSKKEW